MRFEITSRDQFVDHFRRWRASQPLTAKQVSKLLGISLLRVHLYETGCFKFDPDRENAVWRRLQETQAHPAGTASHHHGGHDVKPFTRRHGATANHGGSEGGFDAEGRTANLPQTACSA
ncbi:MAG: hypothetical protein JO069_06965 [Verrucomicrobia bacterium]|nr:hypothetical protein [Verrucomicrobiota bacterium]